MILLLHALHHDEEYWGQYAQAWRPERWAAVADAGMPVAFLPFLDGIRRCAGMYTAELQFACYLHAWTVLCDVQAVLPALPHGSLDLAPVSEGSSTNADSASSSKQTHTLGCGTSPDLDCTGRVLAREGALAWISEEGISTAASMGKPTPHAEATTRTRGTNGLSTSKMRLGLIKRPDMFTGLDGHVAFTATL
jgi:hypothetical protein